MVGLLTLTSYINTSMLVTADHTHTRWYNMSPLSNSMQRIKSVSTNMICEGLCVMEGRQATVL